ncbi:translocation/assembly module TamB domain-containing protein [Marinobacter nauticus]|uniref:translocation/assembly module TamB domain-containing protein n=1 Tax=Marinobacter nauticus TaxID=2743 RepID=UPI001C99FA94|nr:translocation/assembly module TamB domain-containing protein [Marinobacter nauticus]MBY5938160.1 translocation/assembly module TamB [Marinobacter nauticus]MBY5955389.1 translocation/assembly module TamB [Marinobacter nauticus]MBY6009180.1 translocation/assembly module TamB [Marinobacter nauticus]
MTETQSRNTQSPDAEPETRKKRHWWFWPLVIVLVLLLVPLLLVVAVLLALRSETGTAWVIEQVPGLRTEAAEGSMLGQWRADELVWQGYGVGVQVSEPEIDWSPSCLLELTVCLDTLKAASIAVTVQETPGQADQPRGDIRLPSVNLPLGVNIREVRLGALTVNDNLVWNRVELDSRASGATLNIDHLLYERGDILVTADGRAEMRRDWPLNLSVNVTLPPPSGDDWQIALDLSGSARDLRVAGASSGYLDARLEGEMDPLDADLPATLKLQSPEFRPHSAVPETLTLDQWRLELDGSLARGFDTRTRAMLPASTGPVEASVQGLVTLQGASGVEVTMIARDREGNSDGRFGANGKVSWRDGIDASADITLEEFPWYGLIPGLEPPPVVLKRLDGQVQYGNGRYQAALDASVAGPLGEAELTSRLIGDLQSVSLSQLDMTTGAGALSGQAELVFSGPLSWEAQFELDRFNPGFWVPQLEARLNGTAATRGQLREGALPELFADLDLSGQWRQQPAQAKGTLSTQGRDWVVQNFNLSVGDNRLEGSGRYGESLAGDLRFDLAAPQQLLAGLGGEAAGRLRLAGSPEAPEAELSLTAGNLAWQDQFLVTEAQLEAGLDSDGVLDLDLSGTELRLAGQELDNVVASLSGTRERHTLALQVDHPEASVELEFAGGLGEKLPDWRGQLTRGRISVPEPGQIWQLDTRADLTYVAGTLELGSHCWRWQQSSVCAADQRLWPDSRIAYEVRGFPASALAPLFPETFRWQSTIDADIAVALTDAGPDGTIRIDAGAGEFGVLVLDDWQPITHDQLVVEANLKPDEANVSLDFSGPELGQFDLDLAVDPLASDRTVDGEFRLQALNLAFLSAFTGIEDIQGRVNGSGRLNGPLMKPDVTGELVLSEGRVFDPGLPLPLEELLVVLEFRGQSADISGRWKSNDRSKGQVSGSLEWAQSPQVAINLKGERLPVTLEPYARLEVAPDLDIAFKSGELSVSGRVEVPRGEIEVQSVPPSAVSVSEDEVIVGVEREEPAIRSMLMDVTVVVGEDEVSFAAFGVTGNLEGTLRIGNNMDTRGALQLVNGRYEAFGQELDLRRARILFVGALTRPYLDIEAVREVDTVVAGIRLSGPVDEPETEVFSEPSMPQSDALSYVILGRPPRGQGDEGQMSRAALSLGLTQASKITQGIGNELGIRNLTLEAEGSGEQASVVASGYITDELSLRYGVGIFEPITTVALRYDLGRYFYLEAASGLAASLDIFYTRNF